MEEKDQKQKQSQTQTENETKSYAQAREEYQAEQRKTIMKWMCGILLGCVVLYVILNKNEDKYKISYILSFLYTTLKIFVLFILAVLLAYILFTVISSMIEKQRLKSYKHGIKLDINGHTMVVAQYGIEKERSIIILTGLLSASPALHYKPLAEALSDRFRVVILEPFGYGLSETLDPKEHERTVQNIVSEYHAAVKQLGINKYYLLGHSIGGTYSLYWANTYPDEILGCILFDGMTYYSEELMVETDKAIQNIASINRLGIQRLLSIFDDKKIFLPLYSKYNYTKEEVKIFKALALHRAYNELVLNESKLMLNNLIFLKDMKFPKQIPVLDYVCSVNVEAVPNFKDTHLALGTECNNYELIELEGNHLFYFMDNFDVISKKIDSFVAKIK